MSIFAALNPAARLKQILGIIDDAVGDADKKRELSTQVALLAIAKSGEWGPRGWLALVGGLGLFAYLGAVAFVGPLLGILVPLVHEVFWIWTGLVMLLIGVPIEALAEHLPKFLERMRKKT